mmetsp:Transcript_2043/g.6618  ORF Transcript_2043/g.6618 Transcript_2043/m.6618 type:complete len:256 (-) Transcript_2043:1549-2316(-)
MSSTNKGSFLSCYCLKHHLFEPVLVVQLDISNDVFDYLAIVTKLILCCLASNDDVSARFLFPLQGRSERVGRDPTRLSSDALGQLHKVFVLSAHLRECPAKERNEVEQVLWNRTHIKSKLGIDNIIREDVMTKNLHFFTSRTNFPDRSWYFLRLLWNVGQVEGRNALQSFCWIRSLLVCLQLLCLLHQLGNVVFCHALSQHIQLALLLLIHFSLQGRIWQQVDGHPMRVINQVLSDQIAKKLGRRLLFQLALERL